MKEKFKKFMVQGGFAVIIAVLAMSLYLIVMYFGNKYFEKATEPAKLMVNENGEIWLDGFEKEKEENIYVLWETDGGSIEPVSDSEIFKGQQGSSGNMGYFVNTNYNEKIKWSEADKDGHNYKKATIRAVVYSFNESENSSPYYMGAYVNEYNITVEKNEDNVKSAEARHFGNPVREGNDTNWSQIYPVEKSNGNTTYRYRTGADIGEVNIVLCWESDKGILSETDYAQGMYNCKIKKDNSGKKQLLACADITVSDEEAKSAENISAFLVSEDTYNSASDGKAIENDKRHNAAVLK